jgi:ketosteroid isomerase-like protein
MTQADVETLRAEYETMSRRDWNSVLNAAHSDFELRTPADAPQGGTFHGRDEVRRAFEDFFSPYEEVRIEPQEFFERGDRIVVFFVQRCRPRGSNAMVEIQAGHLWTMRDGKPARLEIFPKREKALEAADRDE